MDKATRRSIVSLVTEVVSVRYRGTVLYKFERGNEPWLKYVRNYQSLCTYPRMYVSLVFWSF